MPTEVVSTEPVKADSGSRVGELLHRISNDVKTITSDEIELAKGELAHTVKTAATEAAIVMLGALVALVGLGMLCVAAVAALAPVIDPLWARLLIMAGVYLIAGGALAGVFARRLKRDAKPDFSTPVSEAKQTVESVKSGLKS